MTETTKNQPSGPLRGVKIIDMTSVVLGPYATQILGDLGAEIIKVENPKGDIMRWAGHPPSKDMGPVFLTINRNKRCVTLDLSKPEDQKILQELVKDANAFMTNVREGGLARLGFDYEGMKKINPNIVYVHAVGFGSDGPYAGRQAYDDLVQAACGIADIPSHVDGNPEPRFVPALIADKCSGLHMVYAALAALYHQLATGEGQYVEMPMLEAMVSFTLVEHFYGQVYEEPRGRWTYTRTASPNRKPFQTKDGYMGIMPYTDTQWPLFFELAGQPELWDEWRDASYADRTNNIDRLYALVEQVAVTKTTQEWMDILDANNIPCMRVNRLEDLHDDPHLKATNFFEIVDHPTEGRYYSMKHPVRFSKTPASTRMLPRHLGEDNEDIKKELGLS